METHAEIQYGNLTATYSLADSETLKELHNVDMCAEIVDTLSKEIPPKLSKDIHGNDIVTISAGGMIATYTKEAEEDYKNYQNINLEKLFYAVMLMENQYTHEHPDEVFKWGEVHSLGDISAYNGPTYRTYEWDIVSKCFQYGYAEIAGFGEHYGNRQFKLVVTHLEEKRRGVTITSILQAE